MKFKCLKSILLLAVLLVFAQPARAQLMLNIETGSGTKRVSVEDIEQIDFDESSIWSLNFSDEAGTAYIIPLHQHPIIRFHDGGVVCIQSDNVDNPEIWIPTHHLLSNMSFATISTGISGLKNESEVRLSVDGNSLSVSLGTEASVEVFAVDGRYVYSNPSASGDLRIPLQPGIFIVKINDQTFKIKR